MHWDFNTEYRSIHKMQDTRKAHKHRYLTAYVGKWYDHRSGQYQALFRTYYRYTHLHTDLYPLPSRLTPNFLFSSNPKSNPTSALNFQSYPSLNLLKNHRSRDRDTHFQFQFQN